MKKYLFFLVILPLFFAACSNDEAQHAADLINGDEVAFNNDTVYFINNLEDMFSAFGIEPITKSENVTNDENSSLLKSDVAVQTVYGYSSVTSGSKSKMSFSSTAASQLGVTAGAVYICYTKTVKIIIPLNGKSLFQNPSPNCGYMLNSSGTVNFTTRGYSMSPGLTDVTLTTYVFNVYSTLLGSLINKDKPCTPSNLAWSYILY